jgi:hypothetical protein
MPAFLPDAGVSAKDRQNARRVRKTLKIGLKIVIPLRPAVFTLAEVKNASEGRFCAKEGQSPLAIGCVFWGGLVDGSLLGVRQRLSLALSINEINRWAKLWFELVDVPADHQVNDFSGRNLVLLGGRCQPVRYLRRQHEDPFFEVVLGLPGLAALPIHVLGY